MYINIVYFISKTLGVGAGNNPVRSSISDQCYFYAKYDKNASTRDFSGSKITHSKSVARCVAIINMFYNK